MYFEMMEHFLNSVYLCFCECDCSEHRALKSMKQVLLQDFYIQVLYTTILSISNLIWHLMVDFLISLCKQPSSGIILILCFFLNGPTHSKIVINVPIACLFVCMAPSQNVLPLLIACPSQPLRN